MNFRKLHARFFFFFHKIPILRFIGRSTRVMLEKKLWTEKYINSPSTKTDPPTGYPGQNIIVLNVDGYVWLVPYVKQKGVRFLKTIIPSRKATREYLQ